MRLRTPKRRRRPEPAPITLAERDAICAVLLRSRQDDEPDCCDLLGAIHGLNRLARKYETTTTEVIEILRGMSTSGAIHAAEAAIDKAIRES